MTLSTRDALEAVAALLSDIAPEYVTDSACGDRLDIQTGERDTITIQVAADNGSQIPDILDTQTGEVTYTVSHIEWGPMPSGGETERLRAVAVGPHTAAGAARGLLTEVLAALGELAAADQG